MSNLFFLFIFKEYISVFSKNLIYVLCMNSIVICLKLKDNRLGEIYCYEIILELIYYKINKFWILYF